MRNSEVLKQRLSLGTPSLFAVSERMKSYPDLHSFYPEYLTMIHMIIRATVPLMETAIACCRSGNRLEESLAAYFTGHIDEEKGHDEWVLEDLADLGITPSEVKARIPSAAVASLVGSQYYWIRHCHPIALLGHIGVFECHPPSTQFISTLIENSGHPKSAFRTLNRHSQLDVRHRDEFYAFVDSLELQSRDLSLMSLSGLASIHMAVVAFREIGMEPA